MTHNKTKPALETAGNSVAAPEIELTPVGRADSIDAICQLLFDDFTGIHNTKSHSFEYLAANAQMLQDYLTVFWRGGPALENAFCDLIESIRETSVLMLVRDAERMAKAGDKGYTAKLRDAECAIKVKVGVDYRIPDGQYDYHWFKTASKDIESIYKSGKK